MAAGTADNLWVQGLGSFDHYFTDEVITDDMASTGDGLGTTVQQDSQTGKVDYSAMVAGFHKQMGDAKSMRPDKRQRVLNEIYNLVGARAQSDKTLVEYALTYLFTVHGASPNVDWSQIDLIAGGGTSVVNMSKVVRIIDLKYLRKFSAEFTEMAFAMHDESAELRELLKERAVRTGMPITETRAMIDFAKMDTENPYQSALRVQAKYGSVARTERQANQGNSLKKASHNATKIDFIDSSRSGEDTLGPIG